MLMFGEFNDMQRDPSFSTISGLGNGMMFEITAQKLPAECAVSSVNPHTDIAPLIITGMHRSGTSMTASLLERCGLDLGSRMMPAGLGNELGHFENMDFVELHGKLLESQGCSPDAWTADIGPVVSEDLRSMAKDLAGKNLRNRSWGWKDPRTVLFLDFWNETIPNAKFLFVFRSPHQVVDSLFRRGDAVFEHDAVRALKLWIAFNRKIIDFVQRNQDRCLVTDVRTVIEQPHELVSALNERFSMHLQFNGEHTYQQSHLHEGGELYLGFIAERFPECTAIWQELTCLSPFATQPLDTFNLDFTTQSVFTAWRTATIYAQRLNLQNREGAQELRKTQQQVHEQNRALIVAAARYQEFAARYREFEQLHSDTTRAFDNEVAELHRCNIEQHDRSQKDAATIARLKHQLLETCSEVCALREALNRERSELNALRATKVFRWREIFSKWLDALKPRRR